MQGTNSQHADQSWQTVGAMMHHISLGISLGKLEAFKSAHKIIVYNHDVFTFLPREWVCSLPQAPQLDGQISTETSLRPVTFPPSLITISFPLQLDVPAGITINPNY